MNKNRLKPLEGFVRTSKESDMENYVQLVVGSWMLALPLPLVYEILSRVHVESIFSCKCVCKMFFRILTTSEFAELHLTRSPFIDDFLAIQNRERISDLLLVYNCKLKLEKPDTGHSQCDSPPCQTLSVPTTAAQKYNHLVDCIGSCNGLLCLLYRSTSMDPLYYICNPILGEFLALPSDVECWTILPSALFGFCPKTKQYKVLILVSPSICKIHTVGTNGWRTIPDVPYFLPYVLPLPFFESSFRGNLHWIVDRYTVSNFICAFNLETEQARYLPAPVHLNNDNLSRIGCVPAGSLNGSFCISYLLDGKDEVCVMKDYGVKESWTKDIVIDFMLISGFQERQGDGLLKLIDNGDLFLVGQGSSLFCYNLRKGTITDMLASTVPLAIVTSFSPSFILLKDMAVASGRDVEIVQRKLGRNLRSEKGFQFFS